jgi:hypothetical protein
MSKQKKPKTELEPLEARQLYKSLPGYIFQDWSCDEINKLADCSLNLRFGFSNTIAKRNEPVGWLGLILQGTCLLSVGPDKVAEIFPGSVIGYLPALLYKSSLVHVYDITACSDGVISAFYLEDLNNFHKKNPKLAIKLFEFIGKAALDTLHFQFFDSPLVTLAVYGHASFVGCCGV